MKRTDKEAYLPPFTGVVIMDPQQVICVSQFKLERGGTSVEDLDEEEYGWKI